MSMFGGSIDSLNSSLAAMGSAAVRGGADVNVTGLQNTGALRRQKLENESKALGYASNERVANTQANAAMYPATLQQSRFNTVFPWYTRNANLLRRDLNSATASGAGTAGQPAITAGPVWSPAQIQAQVNQSRATNDQTAAGQIQEAQGKMAGQGFSAGSPLMRELAARYQGQALQASTQGENDLRFNSAKDNATQLLSGQRAQEAQYASRQTEANQRLQTKTSALVSLLASLGGLV